ncbi:MAG: hypothetical protein P0107_01455 [Nitrosomonas sp.]|nr:hypothetical protein [Nitrosomonas sp.]
MPQFTKAALPDIGDFQEVPVVEILVSPGDEVEQEAPLLMLETDKASMEVPGSASEVSCGRYTSKQAANFARFISLHWKSKWVLSALAFNHTIWPEQD